LSGYQKLILPPRQGLGGKWEKLSTGSFIFNIYDSDISSYNFSMGKFKRASFNFITNFCVKKYFLFLLVIVTIYSNGFFISTTFADTTNVVDDILIDTHWDKNSSPV
jgi:hypothetical protein